jgi:hypothetical protein
MIWIYQLKKLLAKILMMMVGKSTPGVLCSRHPDAPVGGRPAERILFIAMVVS